jgi:hypothetical protein
MYYQIKTERKHRRRKIMMKYFGFLEFSVDNETYEAYVTAYGYVDRLGWVFDIDDDIVFDEFYSTSTDENDNTDYIEKYNSDKDFQQKVFRVVREKLIKEVSNDDWEYVGNIYS